MTLTDVFRFVDAASARFKIPLSAAKKYSLALQLGARRQKLTEMTKTIEKLGLAGSRVQQIMD